MQSSFDRARSSCGHPYINDNVVVYILEDILSANQTSPGVASELKNRALDSSRHISARPPTQTSDAYDDQPLADPDSAKIDIPVISPS